MVDRALTFMFETLLDPSLHLAAGTRTLLSTSLRTTFHSSMSSSSSSSSITMSLVDPALTLTYVEGMLRFGDVKEAASALEMGWKLWPDNSSVAERVIKMIKFVSDLSGKSTSVLTSITQFNISTNIPVTSFDHPVHRRNGPPFPVVLTIFHFCTPLQT